MQVRHATHPVEFATLDTEQLRERFLVEDLFVPGRLSWTLTHHDRLLLGGAVPGSNSLDLAAPDELRATSLCERREVGILLLSGCGVVEVDGVRHELHAWDLLYLGRGAGAQDAPRLSGDEDAAFYLVSTPAHQPLPTVLLRQDDVASDMLGDPGTASARTIRKYVHEQGSASCELAMGVTTLEPGSVWNTMPAHTHDRRTEAYLYAELPPDARVLHLMGLPEQTRHVVVADRQVVVNPSWSVHTGAGTAPYRFVWATGGENQAWADMDPVPTPSLR